VTGPELTGLLAAVLGVTAAISIRRIARQDPDHDRPPEPDTETAARQSGLIPTPGEDTQ
jgi:hypothetical protein